MQLILPVWSLHLKLPFGTPVYRLPAFHDSMFGFCWLKWNFVVCKLMGRLQPCVIIFLDGLQIAAGSHRHLVTIESQANRGTNAVITSLGSHTRSGKDMSPSSILPRLQYQDLRVSLSVCVLPQGCGADASDATCLASMLCIRLAV